MKIEIFFRVTILLFVTMSYQKAQSQNFTEEQKEMLRLINEFRAERDLTPLRLNTDLNNAAQQHSDDQAANNFLGHTGSDGSDFGQRVKRTDYNGFARAENVAAGNATAQATFAQWKNSRDHRSNMLLDDINEIGIGHGANPNARYKHYWTQVFGKSATNLSVGDHSGTI